MNYSVDMPYGLEHTETVQVEQKGVDLITRGKYLFSVKWSREGDREKEGDRERERVKSIRVKCNQVIEFLRIGEETLPGPGPVEVF